MNFCKFAKLIIARTSKNPKSLEWLQSSDKEKTSLPTPSNFSNLTTVSQKYEFYMKIMQRYPKMYISAKSFSTNLPRLQNYITQSKYWKNGNKHEEKRQFIKTFFSRKLVFSCRAWKKHCLQDCTKCEASDPIISPTHVSVSETTENIIAKTKELANEIKKKSTLAEAVTWLSTTCENTWTYSWKHFSH